MLLRFVGPTVQLHTRPSFCSGEAAVGCLGRAEPERAQRIKASAVPRRAVCGAALFDVPGGIAELGQHELHAPELTLRAEAVLAEDLHLLVEALLLERAARLLEGLAICCCGRTAGPSQHASQAMRSSGSAAGAQAITGPWRGCGGAIHAARRRNPCVHHHCLPGHLRAGAGGRVHPARVGGLGARRARGK